MELVYNSLVNDANLVGYWRFEGNSTHQTQGPDGSDTAMNYVVGKFGQAASFNGSSSQITLGTSINLGAGTSLTISMWVNVSSNADMTMLGQGDGGSNGTQVKCGFRNSIGGDLTFSTYQTSGTQDINSSNGHTADSAWHFVVFTMNSADKVVNIYYDNVLDATGTLTLLPSFSGKTLSIGALRSSNWYNRYIDDLAIFTRVLTTAEMTSLYNPQVVGGAAGFAFM